ncbi:MAG: hypothetical protein WC517_03330 [Patescibacteria group bacterium]
MITKCCVCGKIRDAAGTWVEVELPKGTVVSHGLCPWCSPEQFIRLEVPKILRLLCHISSDLDEAGLEEMPFVPELLGSGFLLKFENGMGIGLYEKYGILYYTFYVPRVGAWEKGMIEIQPQPVAWGIYNRVIDILLAAPPSYKKKEEKS